jgi:5-methylcytosine-specific restriction endonuclease McrA
MSNQNYVFVLDTNKKPLNPCRPITARKLLNANKAAVFRRYPFTIILKKEVSDTPKTITLKLDPGSKTTGIALLQGEKVVFGAELTHRGQAINASLESRRSIRRSRRARHTRYRQPRFLNRTRPKGWLAPSLQHRVETILTWVGRFVRFVPVGSVAQELVRFDLQQLENPEISGIEYQQGELQGYEVREYLLNKWDRKCAYCNVGNVPLQVEHIHPKAYGGSNRISNLCLACDKCNIKKGTQDIKQFLAKKPDILKRVLAQAKCPLKDATAVNSTRWALFNRLKAIGLPVSTGSGGLTKFNRTRLQMPKAHWLDAACVGKVESLLFLTQQPLLITAKGWGCRQMVQTDKYGFPRKGYRTKQKVKNWNTGDIISVVAGKLAGITGKRLKTVRFKGNFDIRLSKELVISVSRNDIKAVHRKDGYDYKFAQV